MPWQEQSTMSLREEFVRLAQQEGANVTRLCQRFGISRKTGYKWLGRARTAGADLTMAPAVLADRSRRPQRSPRRTSEALEAQVLAERAAHPCWGGRKLQARLRQQHAQADGSAVPPGLPGPAGTAATVPSQAVPSASTITTILRRHGHLPPPGSPLAAHAFRRFEHAAPNLLWQMDFKGYFPLPPPGQSCHPLTVLDDHSRFALGLVACANERAETVQQALTAIFQRYGLPERMLMDNGSPWGGSEDPAHPWTALTVWLLRLGVAVSHGRPRHPQTQGKDERFHRTLHEELLSRQIWLSLAHAQTAFDRWRDEYNLQRPHTALGYAVPAARYQPSPRPFPAALPPLRYDDAPEAVRLVQPGGRIRWQGRRYRVGRAFLGLPVVVRPTAVDGCWQVYFAAQVIASINQHLPLTADL